MSRRFSLAQRRDTPNIAAGGGRAAGKPGQGESGGNIPHQKVTDGERKGIQAGTA